MLRSTRRSSSGSVHARSGSVRFGSVRFGSPLRWLAMAAMVLGLSVSCLDRPIAPASPTTSNVYVNQVPQASVDKIDLLFVVDNSASMADKQRILKDAVPTLVRRLIEPRCVAADNPERFAAREPNAACPSGFQPEFRAIEDMHIGVISSSLGGHGGLQCSPQMDGYNPTDNDSAHLLPSVRANLSSWNGSGFLVWDPNPKHTHSPPGESVLATLESDFEAHVVSAGETGCGYEATLESWYRFLVDDAPPLSVAVDSQSQRSLPSGVDQALLAQRAAFLRPDSLLAIIVLSDENDCSIQDQDFGYRTSSQLAAPRATSACDADPNDRCCRSCESAEATPPADCAAIAADPACRNREVAPSEDNVNLRCFQQQRRFGIDFLYPTQRYVAALTEPQVRARDGSLVDNPIFRAAPGKAPRDKSLVLLAGIVGVPWQDIADADSVSGAGLRYLNGADLQSGGRWSSLLGDPSIRMPPGDPLMIETQDPRTGVQPILGVALAPSASQNPQENPVNGHEYHVPGRVPPQGKPGDANYVAGSSGDDLQYACIFPLTEPIDCSVSGASCDCGGDLAKVAAKNSPLCQAPSGGPSGSTQYFAKGYPGTRHLEVLRGLGSQGVVASICPKRTMVATAADKLDPSYGYNPAVNAIIDRIKIALVRQCLPRQLVPQQNPASPDYGTVPCVVVEARPAEPGQTCSCARAGRSAPRESVIAPVEGRLASAGVCDRPNAPACTSYCLCEIDQLRGAELLACQAGTATDAAGYCYVDAEARNAAGHPAPIGNPALVADCPATSRRILRFIGQDTPANGSISVIACQGASLSGT